MSKILPAHLQIGQLGEQKAKKYLVDLGYCILKENYRYKKSEIDLIAQHTDTIIFIEVKTRKEHYLAPERAVDIKKQKAIVRAARYYIAQHQLDLQVRFDVVSICLNPFEIVHFKDAFWV